MTRRLRFLLVLVPLLFEVAVGEEAMGVSGDYVKGELDNAGNLHVIYAEAWHALYYTKFDGSSWTKSTWVPNSEPCWVPFTAPHIDIGPDGRWQDN